MAKARRKSTYPQTVKAGIPRLDTLPNGWSRSTLKPYLDEKKRSVKMDDDKTYDLVTVKRARGGVAKRETRLGRDISVKTQFEIQENDFLISKRQIVHGACGVVPTHLHGSTVSNEYSVLCANDKLDLQFLKYLSHSQHFQRTCFHSSIGVHIEKMIFKLDQWFKWEFDIPPILEQRRIAEILGTWDRAIAVTEALIARSEAQKKALMQQLLTGKRRLPGFEGEWRDVKMSKLGDVTSGGTPKSSKSEYWDGTIPWLTPTDVTSLKSDFVDVTPRMITMSGVESSSAKLLPVGSLLVCTRATIGAMAINTVPMATNQGFKNITPNSDCDIQFLLLLLKQKKNDLLRLGCGSTFLEVSKSDFSKLELNVPPVEEQVAVRMVIDNAEQQRLSLAAKLQTLKTEKAALMQQLLTGKRRVKLTEAA